MNIAESLDHFVVPVDDMVVAEEFYVQIFGGEVTKRNGLNVRQRKRGAVPHTFIQIGGKRMGVYLQSEERPKPATARDLPIYSFTTTERGLEQVENDLNLLGVSFQGPLRNAHSFADQSLFFTDPAGNHYAVYTPKAAISPASAGMGRITAVGYLELEAPDVQDSINFYAKVLGFELQSRNTEARQAVLRWPTAKR
jgi:catechol 2,3-dioxygenase-like lactoylglutathione lyase family enzyme